MRCKASSEFGRHHFNSTTIECRWNYQLRTPPDTIVAHIAFPLASPPSQPSLCALTLTRYTPISSTIRPSTVLTGLRLLTLAVFHQPCTLLQTRRQTQHPVHFRVNQLADFLCGEVQVLRTLPALLPKERRRLARKYSRKAIKPSSKRRLPPTLTIVHPDPRPTMQAPSWRRYIVLRKSTCPV